MSNGNPMKHLPITDLPKDVWGDWQLLSASIPNMLYLQTQLTPVVSVRLGTIPE